DDARAQDNWQRLDPDRHPWRLVAPYRFQIDRAFREAQPPAGQERLRVLAGRLCSNHLAAALRGLSPALAAWKAQRTARNAMPPTRDFVRLHGPANPALALRLAQLVTIKIVKEGTIEDVEWFRQTFGAPPDDPQLHRLKALVGESTDEPNEAVPNWLAY